MSITKPSQTEQDSQAASPEELGADDWFATGERISSTPPSSRRPPVSPPNVPPEPIGDQLADVWFR
jgi:hypothetical protein